MLGSAMIGAGLELDAIFHVLAGLGLLGAALTLLVPMARGQKASGTAGIPEPRTTAATVMASNRPDARAVAP